MPLGIQYLAWRIFLLFWDALFGDRDPVRVVGRRPLEIRPGAHLVSDVVPLLLILVDRSLPCQDLVDLLR